MAMKRCPVCGEKYSDTYRRCPFCEEEKTLREEADGRRAAPRRRGGHRVARQEGLLSSALTLAIIAMICALVYLLFGNAIAEKLGLGGAQSASGAVSSQQMSSSASGGEEPVIGSAGASSPPADMELDYETASALPAGLTLSATDFSLFTVGESSTLEASGGSGSYRWFSEDEGVASVDENGKVTAISRGDIKILVTDGEKMALCDVRVKVSGDAPVSNPTPSGSENKLSKEDFTLYVGQPDVKLTVSGVTTALTWSSSDTGVATVTSNGVVKAVGRGTATVTVSWDGVSLHCIVRVPG